ncbi:hypothetical protein OHU89_51925 [Streptomyces sp. NBC_00019]
MAWRTLGGTVPLCDAASTQREGVTSETSLHALDRVLVALCGDPDIGEPLPGTSAGPQPREYTDEADQVRVV